MTGYARIDRGSYYQWARQKGLGKDATSMGMYLLCGSESTQHGLYHLTLPTACHYLQLTEPEALEALGDLAEAPCKPLLKPLQAPSEGCDWFAKYDPASSWVWVRNAVRYQVSPEPIKATDNRAKGGCKWYAGLPNSPFLGAFFDHWGVHLCLEVRRPGKPLASPFAESLDPLASQEQEQEQDQDQEQEQEKEPVELKPDAVAGPLFDATQTTPPPLGRSAVPAKHRAVDVVVQRIYGRWRMHHRRAPETLKYNSVEWKKINDRVEEGHGEATIGDAIDGFHQSDFHNGKKNGKKQLAIKTILRDAGQIEAGLEFLDTSSSVRLSDQNRRNLTAAAQWAEDQDARDRERDHDHE